MAATVDAERMTQALQVALDYLCQIEAVVSLVREF